MPQTNSSFRTAPGIFSTRAWKWFYAACGQVSKPRTLAVIITFCIIMTISIFAPMPKAWLTVKNSSAGASKILLIQKLLLCHFRFFIFLNIKSAIQPSTIFTTTLNKSRNLFFRMMCKIFLLFDVFSGCSDSLNRVWQTRSSISLDFFLAITCTFSVVVYWCLRVFNEPYSIIVWIVRLFWCKAVILTHHWA